MKYRKTCIYDFRNNSNNPNNNSFNGNSYTYSNDTGRLETLYYFYFECVINYL